jgi:hypothetical protein
MFKLLIVFAIFYIFIPLGIAYVSHIPFSASFVLIIFFYFLLGCIYDRYKYKL